MDDVRDDHRPADPQALEPWLQLLHAPGLGSRGINQLLLQLQEPAEILARISDPGLTLVPEARAYLRSPDQRPIDQDLAWLEQPDRHLLTRNDPRYPELLATVSDPPPVLFIQGNPELLSGAQLAIVGSRNPSASGRQTALEFSRCLAEGGLTIDSGLAVGIDAACHRGALQAGGHTIAVTGTGLDRVYPARHRELAHQIAEQGALVSEFPPGTPPTRGNFPRRNRIISGLSVGTLVVEAAIRSGSLITARLAAEQGREVFAIPGSIHNPLARGCHQLIRQGAKLVETAADIIEELWPLLGHLQEAPAAPASPPASGEGGKWDAEYQRLLEVLGFDPLPVDLLIQRSGLTAESVSSMLLLLELEGYVSSAPGGHYSLTGKNNRIVSD